MVFVVSCTCFFYFVFKSCGNKYGRKSKIGKMMSKIGDKNLSRPPENEVYFSDAKQLNHPRQVTVSKVSPD